MLSSWERRVTPDATCRVSVVVPTHERRDSVARLVRCLEQQTLPAAEFEVVVSVDGSTDGTLDLLQRTPWAVRVVPIARARGGRAAACNAGIRAARGDLLVLLDDDMEPIPEFLELHLRAHEGSRRRGVMGAAPIPEGNSGPPAARYIARKFNQHLEHLARIGRTLRLREFYSGNFSIRRDVLREIGGFDEDFRVYGNEDLELFLRLCAAGVEISFDPAPRALQRNDKDFRALARDNREKGRTAVLLASKHPEAFRELKLSSLKDARVPVRVARDAALAASRMMPVLPDALLAAVTRLERIAPGQAQRLYAPALGYFYWLGVHEAIARNRERGSGLRSLRPQGDEAR
jgi:GT2 family glycosyltransferase